VQEAADSYCFNEELLRGLDDPRNLAERWRKYWFMSNLPEVVYVSKQSNN